MLKGKGAVSAVLRENDFEPRDTSCQVIVIYEGNWKTSLDMQGLRKFITQIPSLRNLLNAVIAAHKNNSRVVRQLFEKKKKKMLGKH